MTRYIGQVQGWSNPYLGHHTWCGAIYDTAKPRRTPHGDMKRDYAFVEFTESFAREERAMSELQARLAWLNEIDVAKRGPCR